MKVAKHHEEALSHADLVRVLSYDPDTGIFVWAINRCRLAMRGSKAGAILRGYIRIKINGRSYYAHRLAWFWMTGEWPVDRVDHINRDKSDNRWVNLRDVNQSENFHNMDGVLGYSWDCRRGKWLAHIRVNNKGVYLGRFEKEMDARAAYLQAKERYGLNPPKEGDN